MSEQTIQIIDHGTGGVVDAILHDELDALALIEAEKAWGPYRIEATRRLIKNGAPPDEQPQHWHWNWEKKSSDLNLLAYRGIGIECEGHMQGLMLLRTAGTIATLNPDVGKSLVYVPYIESAPWNTKALEPHPRFGGIGIRLFEAAVRVSMAEGYKGRLGLHSLPQAERFYRDICKMQDCGLDAKNPENLRYFELTHDASSTFLKEA
ncbi:GNAT family N-acetyltransferase [Planctomycetales bacterium ZRK34]|nr:GNAT family N-acetyltransferase [Planctomycetales bacterium ZRK34]